MIRIPTHRSLIERAARALIDALEANPWLLPVAGFLMLLIANYPQ